MIFLAGVCLGVALAAGYYAVRFHRLDAAHEREVERIWKEAAEQTNELIRQIGAEKTRAQALWDSMVKEVG